MDVWMIRRVLVNLLFVLVISQAGLWAHHQVDALAPTHHSEHCGVCHLVLPAVLASSIATPTPIDVVNTIIAWSPPQRAYHATLSFSARAPPSEINAFII
ncbi:hypothetical protein [Salinivibrio socompensis]|uniref:hypothetical protein n=1 Tax=Salinivibrio socompensis TaxID=1510206 RepID=UPI0005634AE8|nr:hypothetical protein [Salinivibrio socompensis]